MKKNKGTILGIIFLVWFFASLAGILLVSKTQHPAEWLLILFGQYFLVFGMLAVWSSRGTRPFPTIILTAVVVGLGCMGSGIYMMVGGEGSHEKMNAFAPFMIVGAFFVVGCFMLHMALSQMCYLKRVCTYEVNARCVDVTIGLSKRKHGGYNEIYMPTYSFWLNGEEHRVWNNQYSSIKFEIGNDYRLLVNPKNVSDFIDSNTRLGNIGLLIIGTIFVIVSGSVIVFMVQEGWTFIAKGV